MCIENCCNFQNHINTEITGGVVAWHLTLKRKLYPLFDVVLLPKSRRSFTDCYIYFIAIFAMPPGAGNISGLRWHGRHNSAELFPVYHSVLPQVCGQA